MPHSSPPWQVAGSKNNKKQLSHTSPYKTGTGEAMENVGGPSIAPVRPAHMENECLVVAGFNKDLTQ